MINITIYNPKSVYPNGDTGFRSYDAVEVEKLVQSENFYKMKVSEVLWELDKLCKRAYLPGFCYMADIYFSEGIKLLYAEDINFIEHCKMWGKDLSHYDGFLFSRTSKMIGEFYRLLPEKSKVLDCHDNEEFTVTSSSNFAAYYVSNGIKIKTNKQTLLINNKDESDIVFENNILYTKSIINNYPDEYPKETPGITSI